jgi:multidrug resistance protein, MATE family
MPVRVKTFSSPDNSLFHQSVAHKPICYKSGKLDVMKLFANAYAAILKLALPLIFIQLCQATLGLVDTLIAGRYSSVDLAAVGLGSNLWTPLFILFTGVLYVLVPKFARAFALGNEQQVVNLFGRGHQLGVWLSALGFLMVNLFAFMCPLLIADAQVAQISKNYLHFISFGFPGLVYLLLYRFVCEGSSKLFPVMVTSVLLLLFNGLFNLVFVYGWGPVAPMGGAGCGLATTLAIYITLVYTRWLTRRTLVQIKNAPDFQDDSPEVPATPVRLLLEGLPIGIALVVEVLAIVTLAFFAASLGVEVIAAHQIAINIAMVCFMVPVALSNATTIIIAHFRAQNDARNKKYTGWAAMSLALLYGVGIGCLLLMLGKPIVNAFSTDQQVVIITAGLIVYVALFQLFDAIQIVASGILRGVEQFAPPMLVMVLVYWVLVVPISYILGIKGWGVDVGPGALAGIDLIWLILAAGLGGAALILTHLSRRHLR